MRPSDDTEGLRAAWNPTAIVFAAFLGGPFTLVGLSALNFGRLGELNRARATWILGSILSVAWVAGSMWLGVTGLLSESVEDAVGLVTRIGTVGAGLVLARLQRPGFRRVEVIHGRAGLLWPGLGAVLIGIFLVFVMSFLVVGLSS